MWKRALRGASGSKGQRRLRRLVPEVLLVVAVGVGYPLATPHGPSRAGDGGGDLLAPPIGGPEGAAVPEVQATGLFFPGAEPALAVAVTPPPPPKPPSGAGSGKRSVSPPPTPRPVAEKAPPADPDDLGVLVITCYTLTSNTASGSPPDPSTAATSSGFLPLGTVISIEGVGTFTVKDRGPLGRKIDIWMASNEECTAFGKRYLRVRVISRP